MLIILNIMVGFGTSVGSTIRTMRGNSSRSLLPANLFNPKRRLRHHLSRNPATMTADSTSPPRLIISFTLFLCPVVYAVTKRNQLRRMEGARRTERDAERGETFCVGAITLRDSLSTTYVTFVSARHCRGWDRRTIIFSPPLSLSHTHTHSHSRSIPSFPFLHSGWWFAPSTPPHNRTTIALSSKIGLSWYC